MLANLYRRFAWMHRRLKRKERQARPMPRFHSMEGQDD